jgi:hypothetical protein
MRGKRGHHGKEDGVEETEEERLERLTDDFEGWDDDREASEWSEEGAEAEAGEVEVRRKERLGLGGGEGEVKMGYSRSWGSWWEKEM